MEAAVDIDSAGDFSVHSSHSGIGSRSRSSAYSSAGLTLNADVESGEAALISGTKGHRSTYAKLAEEALLGAAGPPSDPEGAFDRVFDVPRPSDLGGVGFQDGSGGAWHQMPQRKRSSASSPTVVRDAKSGTKHRTRCKTLCWAPAAAGIIAVIAAACCWDLRPKTRLSPVRPQAKQQGAVVETSRVHRTAPSYCADNATGCGEPHCGVIEQDVVYPGGDLYSVGGVPSATACCDICGEEPKCTSWSWADSSAAAVFRKRCFLKRQSELTSSHSPGYVSGLPRADAGQFQLKNRHGLCLEFTPGGAKLEACAAKDVRAQRLTFERMKLRISTDMELCLQVPESGEGSVSVRSCGDAEAQQWTYDSSTGSIRTSGDLCLHALERKTRGSKVEARSCDERSEAQQWSFWSVETLHLRATIEAMREEALEPTTTTATTTTTTKTTTTTTSAGPKLYCFSVMVSWNYEPTLVKMQVMNRRSIFLCDSYDVYSDKVLDLGTVQSRVVHGTDLKCHIGGVFNTLLNTPVFIKVWEQVMADGRFRQQDWTVKADCDAVFLPDRLRRMVEGPALQGAQDGRGIFINNCGFGLHGPLEVVSTRALETYREGYEDCPNPPQEDVYLQACMNHLGVKQVNQFTLLSEDHCRTPNWEDCQSEHVSFHPFKEVEAYEACVARAEEASMQVKKK